MELSNYEYLSIQTSYKINYEGYRTRLITAQEIAQITGADKKLNWNERIPTDSYNFETMSGDYGWLYNRTLESCEEHGVRPFIEILESNLS